MIDNFEVTILPGERRGSAILDMSSLVVRGSLDQPLIEALRSTDGQLHIRDLDVQDYDEGRRVEVTPFDDESKMVVAEFCETAPTGNCYDGIDLMDLRRYETGRI